MVLDVNTVVDDIGVGTFQWVQLFLIGGIWLADGAEILVSSSIIGALSDIWGLSYITRGFMMSAIFLGVFLGGVLGGNLADIVGRRPMILVSYLGIICFGAGTAAINDPWSMIAMRFFFGASFGCGIAPGVALMVETAPANSRGLLLNLGGFFFAAGEIYTSYLLMVHMPSLTSLGEENAWRRVTVLSVIPGAMIFPLSCFLLRESPHFLLSQGRSQEALEVVKYIAYMNGKESKMRELDAETGGDPEASSSGLDDGGQVAGERTALLAEQVPMPAAEPQSASGHDGSSPTLGTSEAGIHSMAAKQEHVPSRLTTLQRGRVIFGPDLIGIVFGGAYCCFLGNFLFYGMTYAMPQIFRNLGSQINPAQQVMVISLCDVPGTALACFCVLSHRLSHRDGLSMLAMLVAVLQIGMISIDHHGWVRTGLVIAPLSKFGASAFFSLIYVYLGEVFPAAVRCTAVALCIGAGRFGSILSPICFEMMSHNSLIIGRHVPYFMLNLGLCVGGVFFIQTLLSFELKNAPLEDVPPRKGMTTSGKTTPPAMLQALSLGSMPELGARKRTASSDLNDALQKLACAA